MITLSTTKCILRLKAGKKKKKKHILPVGKRKCHIVSKLTYSTCCPNFECILMAQRQFTCLHLSLKH